MNKRVCIKCGSDRVVKDAWAEWDEDSQQWVLGAFFDDDYCLECEEETTIIEKNE